MKALCLSIRCWYVDNVWRPCKRLLSKIRVVKYHVKHSSAGEKLERWYYRLWKRRKIRKLNDAS